MKTTILDCTLRDGGYCNDWKFGRENIKEIIKGLFNAGVDMIEGGFLSEKSDGDPNTTLFHNITDLSMIMSNCEQLNLRDKCVLMINYGEYNPMNLPDCDESGVAGLRLAFHKENSKEALKLAKIIKQKGYRVFLQPMVSLSYSDAEFLDLIHVANEISPEAFYIVDSFGSMKKRDLSRLFYMTDNNLDNGIKLGFHSHNNMQQAYANAQMLADMHARHDLIIDGCIYGMGRGAGNLNTELFMEYLNDNQNGRYDIKPLIRVIDRVLDRFYKESPWGYSLSNYISAYYGAHPNYAGYLSDKNALNVEDIDAIIEMMPHEKRVRFDKDYVASIYTKYLSRDVSNGKHKEELQKRLTGASILLIAPGKSSYEEKERIISYVTSHKTFVISVNHNYEYVSTDYVFFSNLRRFEELRRDAYGKCIVTSNIPTMDTYLQTEYSDLLNDDPYVRDNAGLMAIKFLIRNGVKEISLVGFDGYSHDSSENYADKNLLLITKRAIADAMNKGMMEMIGEYGKNVVIRFLTSSKYDVEKSDIL